MPTSTTKVQELADDLVGTCVTERTDDIEALTVVEARELDELVFNCECCGWWCSTDEENESKSGQQVCDDCLDDEDGDS